MKFIEVAGACAGAYLLGSVIAGFTRGLTTGLRDAVVYFGKRRATEDLLDEIEDALR